MFHGNPESVGYTWDGAKNELLIADGGICDPVLPRRYHDLFLNLVGYDEITESVGYFNCLLLHKDSVVQLSMTSARVI